MKKITKAEAQERWETAVSKQMELSDLLTSTLLALAEGVEVSEENLNALGEELAYNKDLIGRLESVIFADSH